MNEKIKERNLNAEEYKTLKICIYDCCFIANLF